MIIGNEKEVLPNTVKHPEAKNAAMKVLISPEQGWAGYVMRIIEVEKDGFSPRHIHDWPHINYMIEGSGTLYLEGEETPVEAGSYAYVPAGKEHQYRNNGDGPFRFICIVPEEGHV